MKMRLQFTYGPQYAPFSAVERGDGARAKLSEGVFADFGTSNDGFPGKTVTKI